MAYDDNAKRLAIKAIGTVESRLNYSAINYGDPITVGIMQWYGVRAASILKRMKAENPGSWSGVEYSIDIELAITPGDNPWWNDRRLTQSEGESLRPILAANREIQDNQAIEDLEVYKQVAINNGMDPEANTNSVIFFFSMYHQGPVYAFQVLSNVGPGASLEQFRNGALSNPVLGQYSNRYNEVYEILKSGDSSGTSPVNPGTPNTTPEGEGTEMALKYIEVQGNNLLLRLENDNLTCYPTTAGRWIPSRQPKAPADTPTPSPTPDPGAPPSGGDGDHSGSWVHPLPGATLTSGYGYRAGLDQPGRIHAGIDLSTTTAFTGGNVLAPCDLEIVQAMNEGEGGFADAGGFVKGITRSGTAYTLSFFHMAAGSVSVRKGQMVSRGTKLGVESQTGYSFGTHLHFEMWAGHIRSGFLPDSPWYWGDGTPIDPIPVLRANGVQI